MTLWYETIITKVSKLSYDTFLKTIGAEMNAPDIRPFRFPTKSSFELDLNKRFNKVTCIYIMYLHVRKNY